MLGILSSFEFLYNLYILLDAILFVTKFELDCSLRGTSDIEGNYNATLGMLAAS